MRRTLLSISFLLLLAAVWGLWQHRFERVSAAPVWRLADIQKVAPQVPGISWIHSSGQLAVRIKVDAKHPRVSGRFGLPGVPLTKRLHFKFRLASERLVQGAQKWEDGRVMVEWVSPKTGKSLETQSVGTIRDDETGEIQSLVMDTKGEAGIPWLRFENLGSSGAFEISNLEITVIQERAIWRVGKWLLALAWWFWLFCMIRTSPRVHCIRALAASAIFLMMSINFVIPGPWKKQKPLGGSFELGPEISSVAIQRRELTPSTIVVGAVSPEGKLPIEGSLPLRIKIAVAQAKPILHSFLLFGPSLALLCLIARRSALSLMIGFALSIELAQILFGYGFDWIDVIDLICDALGIAAAVWCHARLARHFDFLRIHLAECPSKRQAYARDPGT